MTTNTHSPLKLAGKTALVTGASHGIGAAIAKGLAAAGANVVVNYSRSKTGADQVVAGIGASGGKAVAVQADVSSSEDVDRLIDTAIGTYGRLDIVVNNAGVYDFKPLEQITPEHFHKHFDLNVLAPVLVTQKALPYLEAAGGGSVINISSTVSQAPMATASVYGASKAAIDAVTRALAKELGSRRIRVNAISPGTVETEGFEKTAYSEPEVQQHIVSATPLGRLGKPDDIAPVAVFLASDDARWITGKILAVDGGHF